MTIQAITAGKYQGKTEKERLAEGEHLLSQYSKGVPVSRLVEETGLSKPTVHRRLNQAISARLAVTVDAYREVVNATYDEQLQNCERHMAAAMTMLEQAEIAGKPEMTDKALVHHLRAMDMIIKITEHRRKLNGLDAPIKVDATVTVTSPIDTEVEALASQLRERRASRAG